MSSTILRPWQGFDLELIESRDVVLLRPQADPAIGQKGTIPNGEAPRIIKRDRELIGLGDQAKLVPMIECDVRLISPIGRKLLRLGARQQHAIVERMQEP